MHHKQSQSTVNNNIGVKKISAPNTTGDKYISISSNLINTIQSYTLSPMYEIGSHIRKIKKIYKEI